MNDLASSELNTDGMTQLLHPDNKNSVKNFHVCRTMVGSMFDDLLNKGGDENRVCRLSS